jgi:hypothetical protein
MAALNQLIGAGDGLHIGDVAVLYRFWAVEHDRALELHRHGALRVLRPERGALRSRFGGIFLRELDSLGKRLRRGRWFGPLLSQLDRRHIAEDEVEVGRGDYCYGFSILEGGLELPFHDGVLRGDVEERLILGDVDIFDVAGCGEQEFGGDFALDFLGSGLAADTSAGGVSMRL